MFKSVNTILMAACLAFTTLAAIGSSQAAASDSDLVRPEPFKARKSDDTEPNKAFAAHQRQGDIVRVINVGKDVNADSKNGQKKKTASRSGKKTSTRRASYSSMIKTAARKHGVPLKIAKAVVQVESNFNPRARGSAGEVGLMQIKPATARGMGYRGSTKALYDPKTNLEWGMKYLAGAHERASGDVCGTILRYNAGHYAKRMNPVSRRYCRKVQTILSSS